MAAAQLTIDDIVPDVVARAGGNHAKTSAGAPCPNSLVKAVENGSFYFTAGGQTPVAIGPNVLLDAVEGSPRRWTQTKV